MAYIFSSSSLITDLFFDISTFKWVVYFLHSQSSSMQFFNFILNRTQVEFYNLAFYDKSSTLRHLNLVPHKVFSHYIDKHFVKVLTKIKYSIITSPWHIAHMHRFFTFCTGKKVIVRVNGFIKNALTPIEQALCLRWSARVSNYRKLLGNFFFLNESLQIFYLSLKLKDPYFLSFWLTKMFQKISFWKSRVLLSYIRYVVKHFFFARFSELKMRGLKFQLKGKISVAGNARTRTIRYKAGYTSQSTFDNRVLTVFNKIPSFTGVQGFKVW